ncbi:MAG TPA: MFS transporter [Ktedonobacteraceae bacterium]
MHKPERASLWRNRDYMLLWSGQIVSNMGSQVSQLAFPLFILLLTSSPVQAGLAGALRALPYLIFSLPAGALIDRWDRKRVMILCDSGRALALGSIPVAFAFGFLTVAQLFAVSFIEGTLFVFFNIAEVACLPRVVLKEQLPRANAQNIATEGITTLIGPPVSGVLYSIAYSLPFLADAVSYLVSVLSLFFIRTKFQGERLAARRSLWVEIKEGLSWLWHQPIIRFMAILTGGINLLGAGSILVIIVLAQHMHASPFTIGLIFAIGGIGGIVGAIIAPTIQRRVSFGQAIIGSSWLTCLFTLLYIFAPNPLILGMITALFFLTGPTYNVVSVSYRLTLIPDELQGRVNSAFRLIAFCGQPLGLAMTGILLQSINAIPTLLIMAAGLFVFALMATMNRHVRHAPVIAEMQQT